MLLNKEKCHPLYQLQVDIFSERGAQMRLSQQMKHLEIIYPHDNLSTQMCMDCICDLKMSYKFFMQIKKAQVKLKSILVNLTTTDNAAVSKKSTNPESVQSSTATKHASQSTQEHESQSKPGSMHFISCVLLKLIILMLYFFCLLYYTILLNSVA